MRSDLPATQRVRLGSEKGQVLIIVAFSLFFVLLGAAAMTVDYGNGMLQKRNLQNAADMAALAAAQELGRGSDAATAAAKAQEVVTKATGGAVSLPYPPTALPGNSGTGLFEGIEISGSDVRVALRRSIDTFFAGAMGFNAIGVSGRAHANVMTDGVLPITVKRYSKGQSMWQLNDMTNQPDAPVTDVIDHLARDPSTPLTVWPAPPWPSSLTNSVAASPPNQAASEASPGPIVPIVGAEALSNNGNPDFNFFVAPDVRNISTASPEYYNGVLPSDLVQSVKQKEATYFLPRYMGYVVSPLPIPGDQLPTMNGVNHANTVGEMKKWYPPGTVVTTMVYDGTVQSTPDFRVSISPSYAVCAAGSDCNYVVTIKQVNPALKLYGNVQLTVRGGLEGGFANSSSLPSPIWVNGGDTSVNLTVTPQAGASGARTFTVEAYHPLSGTLRVGAAGVMTDSADRWYARTEASSVPMVKVPLGGSTTIKISLDAVNIPNANARDIVVAGPWDGSDPLNGVEWIATAGTPAHSGVWIDPSIPAVSGLKGASGSKVLNIPVNATATAEIGEWLLKIPLAAGTEREHIYVVARTVYTNNANAIQNATDFVYVLGYANFLIVNWDGSYGTSAHETPAHDSNTMWGRAISDIAASPEDLDNGRMARLIPW